MTQESLLEAPLEINQSKIPEVQGWGGGRWTSFLIVSPLSACCDLSENPK